MKASNKCGKAFRMKNENPVLLVESDLDDIFLLRRAFERVGITNPVQVVRDGADAIAYLSGEGTYADRALPGNLDWPGFAFGSGR